MKQIAVKFLLVGMLVTVFQLYSHAQDDPGDPGPDPDLIPLDPGSWVLVAAGVGYGVKKWRDARHKANTEEYPDISKGNE